MTARQYPRDPRDMMADLRANRGQDISMKRMGQIVNDLLDRTAQEHREPSRRWADNSWINTEQKKQAFSDDMFVDLVSIGVIVPVTPEHQEIQDWLLLQEKYKNVRYELIRERQSQGLLGVSSDDEETGRDPKRASSPDPSVPVEVHPGRAWLRSTKGRVAGGIAVAAIVLSAGYLFYRQVGPEARTTPMTTTPTAPEKAVTSGPTDGVTVIAATPRPSLVVEVPIAAGPEEGVIAVTPTVRPSASVETPINPGPEQRVIVVAPTPAAEEATRAFAGAPRLVQSEVRIPATGTSLALRVSPGQVHIVTCGPIRVFDFALPGGADRGSLVLLLPDETDTVDYLLEDLVPTHNWHGVYELGRHPSGEDIEFILAEKLPETKRAPNCIDGCDVLDVLVVGPDGIVVHETQ